MKTARKKIYGECQLYKYNFGTGIPWCGVGEAVSATAAPLMS